VQRHVSLLLAVVAATLGGGCAADFGGGSGANDPPLCYLPTCALDEQLRLAVEVKPAASDATLLQHDDGTLSIDPLTGTARILVPQPITLSGQVIRPAGTPSVGITVVATRPSRIPGRPDLIFQTRVMASGEFALRLPPVRPTEKYELRVVFDDPSLFPPVVTSVAPTTDGRLDLRVPSPDELFTIEGQVADPLGRPVAAMRVAVEDELSGDILSTSVTTDADGQYAVMVPKGATRVRLVARPTKDAAMGLPLLERALDLSRYGTLTSANVPLPIPALPATTRLSYTLVGTGSSGAEVPVAGASCRFTASVTDKSASASGVTAIFDQTATSDLDGTITVDLIPADTTDGVRTYQVTVSPPATSEFQGRTFTLDVGKAGGWGQSLALARRAEVVGRVVDVGARPLAGVLVEPGAATVTATVGATSPAEVVQISAATSASDGRFKLRIDDGAYDLGLLPPALSRLPRRWVALPTVSGTVDIGDVLLPSAAMARVEVFVDGGSAIVGALVQVYALSQRAPDDARCQLTASTCVTPPRILAEGTTSAGGATALLLPAATATGSNAR
jgi:hypothetical protein